MHTLVINIVDMVNSLPREFEQTRRVEMSVIKHSAFTYLEMNIILMSL